MKQKNIFAWVGLYLFLLPVVCIANKGMIIDHGHDPDEKKPPVL